MSKDTEEKERHHVKFGMESLCEKSRLAAKANKK